MATEIREIVSTIFYNQPLQDSEEIQTKKIRMLRPEQYEKLKSIFAGHKNAIYFYNCDGEEDAECNILQSIIGYNLLKKINLQWRI